MEYYKKRIADKLLDIKLKAFGATLIVGPKGCGKTTTAKQRAKSVIEFQDEDKRESYLTVAKEMPSKLLIGENPKTATFVKYNSTKTYFIVRKKGV